MRRPSPHRTVVLGTVQDYVLQEFRDRERPIPDLQLVEILDSSEYVLYQIERRQGLWNYIDTDDGVLPQGYARLQDLWCIIIDELFYEETAHRRMQVLAASLPMIQQIDARVLTPT